MEIQWQKSQWIPKGWGGEEIIDNRDEYCGKILHFVKGKKLSWHYHLDKKETFYLLEGKLTVYLSEKDDLNFAGIVTMSPGDILHIPQGLRHRMEANQNSKLLEISTHDCPEDSIKVEKGD